MSIRASQEGGVFVSSEVLTLAYGFFLCSLFMGFSPFFVCLLATAILDCEVKWALESITTNKASRGDGIPIELFQILKDDAVKVLHSICQQI